MKKARQNTKIHPRQYLTNLLKDQIAESAINQLVKRKITRLLAMDAVRLFIEPVEVRFDQEKHMR